MFISGKIYPEKAINPEIKNKWNLGSMKNMNLFHWGYLLFCLTSIDWLGVPHKSNFCFLNEPIWLAHPKKKLKLWRLPK
jgi:hypothetical protein